MKADLTPIAGDWGALTAITGITRWFWVDTDTTISPRGVHVADALTEPEPAQVTHVWGWGTGRWVRARVDREPGATRSIVRGALLTRSENGTLDMATAEAQVWPAADGRVGMGTHPVLHPRAGSTVTARAHIVMVPAIESDGTTVVRSLTFLELVGVR